MINAAGSPIAAIWPMLSFAPRRMIPSRRTRSAASFRPGWNAAVRTAGARPTTSPMRIATVTSEMTGGR
jgi:hypothetical protein